MKRYNLINNALGWVCFAIAAFTYLLTIEPTASFWDCPEFILQAFKLEVGHPPGNPIFMLAGRFFVNLAGGDVTRVAMMVNCMSALLSAGTILLLFWTITHLVKRLIVKDDATSVTPLEMIIIFASGICGSLAYTWSDTFWFSAVEGEVYAFSSFCTALVFWLILKWEDKADSLNSDKYLILIAYVIGISIAVHLLNLLCIPAIGLVIYYRKTKESTGKGSLIALLLSCVVVGLILFGLVPGFVEVSQYFELFFVNVVGLSFNMGVLIYALLFAAACIWAIYELYAQNSKLRLRVAVGLSVALSGLPFIGDSLWIPVVLLAALVVYLARVKEMPIRVWNIVVTSIFVIFIGYSSYALLLIRSSAHTPMNQNAPDNVFALSTYLNREQYGETPLLYGQTINSEPVYVVTSGNQTKPLSREGKALYAKQVKNSPEDADRYIVTGHKKKYVMTPELNMLFPRIYSSADGHPQAYSDWIGGLKGTPVSTTVYVDENGDELSGYPHPLAIKPTMGENIRYFLNYQLNHMYWRYFMWNFAGRQNDIQGNGEVNHGNWISGIPFIDNPRLGDQSKLPYEEGKGNKGHNVFFMLPLILGLIGLLWQAFTSKRGIEQFWVVFFLFFMTGIAIVLYLNQPPMQPRERDYAFAGSFYAYAIWIGMGVAGLWRLLLMLAGDKSKKGVKGHVDGRDVNLEKPAVSMGMAIVAAAVGVLVPLQMVSQTWDDHDRSGRYTARDFGMNYLNSLDENAIIFTNGDNDTFPLWYAQEVEGVRTDVKVVNLSYLTTDWYVNSITRPTYEAKPIDILAKPGDYAYDALQYSYFIGSNDSVKVNAHAALAELYDPASRQNIYGVPVIKYSKLVVPVDTAAMIATGRLTPAQALVAESEIDIDARTGGRSGLTLSEVMTIDMLATSAKNGMDRPLYFAMTVPDRFYLGLNPYLRNTGLAYEVTPVKRAGRDIGVDTEKMYRNVTERFLWGGLDAVKEPSDIYLDETVRRMVTTNRSAMVDLATALVNEGVGIERMLSQGEAAGTPLSDEERTLLESRRDEKYAKAKHVLDLMREKLPVEASPYSVQIGQEVGELYMRLGLATDNDEDIMTGREIVRRELDKYADNVVYYQSLTPSQYASLQSVDKFIDHYYFMDLLYSYLGSAGSDEEASKMQNEVLQSLSAKGVDLRRQEMFQQAAAK